jgi:hypothetical protein
MPALIRNTTVIAPTPPRCNLRCTVGTDTSLGAARNGRTPAGDPTAAVGGIGASANLGAGTGLGAPLGTGAVGGALQPGAVKLTVEQGMAIGKQFVLGDPELLVGREDEEESIYPDIDLSDQDEGYVHRRHATMRFENGQLMVTHLGGVNKTRINNKPIPDDTPQPVNIGDKLSFGKVVMRVGSI